MTTATAMFDSYDVCKNELATAGNLQAVTDETLENALETARYLDQVAEMISNGGQRREKQQANYKVYLPVVAEMRKRGLIS